MVVSMIKLGIQKSKIKQDDILDGVTTEQSLIRNGAPVQSVADNRGPRTAHPRPLHRHLGSSNRVFGN